MEQMIQKIDDCLSIQEGMVYAVHFIDMKGTAKEGELWFNHWFGDGEGGWMCINITDGEVWIL